MGQFKVERSYSYEDYANHNSCNDGKMKLWWSSVSDAGNITFEDKIRKQKIILESDMAVQLRDVLNELIDGYLWK